MKNRSDIFKTNLIYFILMFVFVLLRIIFSLDAVQESSIVSDYLGSVIIQVGVMFGLSFLLYTFFFKKKPKEVFKDYHFTKINFKAVLISIAIGLCAFVLTWGIAVIFSFLLSLLGYTASSGASTQIASWGEFFGAIALSAILPGFCEEFTHRGLLVKGYSSLGAKKTIIYSGLLFGLMHMNISQFFYAAILGALFVLLVMASGSIIPAMIVHFMNNFLSVYFSYSNDLGLPLNKFSIWLKNLLSSYGFLSILLLLILFSASIILIVYLTKQLFKQTYGKKFEKVKKEIAMEYLKDEVMGQIENPEVGTGEAGLVFDEEVDIEGEKRIIKLKIPFERMGVEVKPQYKATFIDNIFLYASFILGAIATIFTFVWGVIS